MKTLAIMFAFASAAFVLSSCSCYNPCYEKPYARQYYQPQRPNYCCPKPVPQQWDRGCYDQNGYPVNNQYQPQPVSQYQPQPVSQYQPQPTGQYQQNQYQPQPY